MPEEVRGAAERLVVVDGELTGQFGFVEERLLGPLAEGAEAGGGPVPLPGVPTGSAGALAALRRVRGALAVAAARGPRVWAPNGRWEHAGLRVVCLEDKDVDLLYAALRALSGALAVPVEPGPGAKFDLDAVLRRLAAAVGGTAAGLVGALARVLAAVDLVPDADTVTLTQVLSTVGGSAAGTVAGTAAGTGGREDVRLNAEQEEAWQRLAHRVTMLLTESVPLHRFLG